MSARASDVVIIGGGIMGSAAALFLARRGRSVTLLESDLIGRQASGTNFGNVRRQGRPFNQLALANRARVIWWNLTELIGEDCEFVKRGHLRLALDEDSAQRMATYADEARHLGLDLEILSGNALRDRFPWVSSKVRAGSLSPLDGHANPRLTSPALARAAARAGAAVLENAKVVAATKPGEDFEVLLEDGRFFRAPCVLLTAGAWSGAFARAFGDPVPLEIKGPQMAVTEPLPYFLGPSTGISTTDPGYNIYFRQVERGNIVIGGPRHGPASIETRRANVLPENTLLQLTKARDVLPILEKVQVIRVWSGIESYTPDAQPVMGASPTVSGLYYAFGFSGAGFQLGPAVGDLMAELIDTGRTAISLAPFAANRFREDADPTGAALVALRGDG